MLVNRICDGLVRFISGFSSYRRPMIVTEVMVFRNWYGETEYAVCPRCQITLEREYVNYCDRCGQCLDWAEFDNAKVVYPGRTRK